MSTDQRYLYKIAQLVNFGIPDSSEQLNNFVLNNQPGVMNHARWMNTAARLLRYYISRKRATEDEKTLVNFVLKVYVCSWFEARHRPSVSDAAKHFFTILRRVHEEPNDRIRKEGLSTLQRNSFLAHPGLILISMAGDDNPSTRRRAADLIRKVMDKPRRKYVLPKLRQSEEYENMIDFEASTYGVPSLLVDWDLSSFQKIIFEDLSI